MHLSCPDEQTVEIGGMNLFFVEVLRRIPVDADPGRNAAARDRLYSSPTHGADPELDAEWKEYIEPDLRELFEAATDVVRRDLDAGTAQDEEGRYAVRIPIKHLRDWIHAMNQARLAIAAKHKLPETEMDHDLLIANQERAMALVQMDWYAELQANFLHLIGSL